jgi:hypothetical protein
MVLGVAGCMAQGTPGNAARIYDWDLAIKRPHPNRDKEKLFTTRTNPTDPLPNDYSTAKIAYSSGNTTR